MTLKEILKVQKVIIDELPNSVSAFFHVYKEEELEEIKSLIRENPDLWEEDESTNDSTIKVFRYKPDSLTYSDITIFYYGESKHAQHT